MLNTLYVTNSNAYLHKDGMNVVVSIDNIEQLRVPIINLEEIVTFGYMGVSPGLMQLCSQNNVSISFLSPSGRFLSRVQGPTKGNVILRKKQYELSEDSNFSLEISRIFIAGKINNYRNIIKRAIRDNGPNDELSKASLSLSRSKQNALQASDSNELRGIEGDAANHYFSIFSHLIRQQTSDFVFNGRSKRPPKDEVNVLLSFAYTLLANDVASALETVGLDPYVGFFHTIRPGRYSLALDMMEELRSYLGDRFVLSLINRKQLTNKHFIIQGEDSLLLNDDGRKILISAWQERKKDEITHPILNEKIPIGLLPFAQAMLLARYIRDDIDCYPVFLI